jgi:REP element-mobilizing transposase RayT
MPRIHLQAETRCYFITANSEARIPVFADPQVADIVIRALYHLRSRGRLKLHAFVLMPDHLHFVASLGPVEDLPRLIHSLKSYTAKEINGRLAKKGKVWQRGYYSHGIRNEMDAVQKIEYITRNPVRAGLSETVEDYGPSSANEAFEIDAW